ncbi:Hypothetical_protein [Hexamita inflata]|uniref:Hypothetical_protein n=1 Tax=Hexamita inflata TaxID=28002 RepID=A0AA86PJN6_9EUKA|nr:Hypothetical protein HINF_LOCUS24517 [Hexamita inflata]
MQNINLQLTKSYNSLAMSSPDKSVRYVQVRMEKFANDSLIKSQLNNDNADQNLSELYSQTRILTQPQQQPTRHGIFRPKSPLRQSSSKQQSKSQPVFKYSIVSEGVYQQKSPSQSPVRPPRPQTHFQPRKVLELNQELISVNSMNRIPPNYHPEQVPTAIPLPSHIWMSQTRNQERKEQTVRSQVAVIGPVIIVKPQSLYIPPKPQKNLKTKPNIKINEQFKLLSKEAKTENGANGQNSPRDDFNIEDLEISF